MAETHSAATYLDPAAAARLKNLGLVARLVVEGLFSGRHRSPRKGFSIEFAEHRQYTPGVDPRHLDWKILAKRDRLYVKQYEEQTNLRGTVLLDASASMGYQHTGAISKLEYAKFITASLAQLMLNQHDAFGLIVCGEQVRLNIPPRQGRRHLRVILDELAQVQPRGHTELPHIFHQLAETMKRRGLVIVVSDLLGVGTTADPLVEALGHFRHKKHEVIALQVLDQAELTFPFRDTGEIQDIETGGKISADAQAIREHYLKQIKAYLQDVQRGCLARGIGYAMTDTNERFDSFLATYLTRRQQMHAARAMV